jgi:hypothetical protein
MNILMMVLCLLMTDSVLDTTRTGEGRQNPII